MKLKCPKRMSKIENVCSRIFGLMARNSCLSLLHIHLYTQAFTRALKHRFLHTHTPTRMHTQAHTHTLFFYTQTCAHKPLHTSFLISCDTVVPNTSNSTAFDTRPSFQERKLQLPQLFTPDPHFLRIDPFHFVRKDHRQG